MKIFFLTPWYSLLLNLCYLGRSILTQEDKIPDPIILDKNFLLISKLLANSEAIEKTTTETDEKDMDALKFLTKCAPNIKIKLFIQDIMESSNSQLDRVTNIV